MSLCWYIVFSFLFLLAFLILFDIVFTVDVPANFCWCCWYFCSWSCWFCWYLPISVELADVIGFTVLSLVLPRADVVAFTGFAAVVFADLRWIYWCYWICWSWFYWGLLKLLLLLDLLKLTLLRFAEVDFVDICWCLMISTKFADVIGMLKLILPIFAILSLLLHFLKYPFVETSYPTHFHLTPTFRGLCIQRLSICWCYWICWRWLCW